MLGLPALGAYNAILGIEPGLPGGVFGAPEGLLEPKTKASAPFNLADTFLLELDSAGKSLWSIRSGDEYAQAAFDVAVDSTGKITSCGITNGTLSSGGAAPPVTFDTYDVFVARFDP